MEFMDVEIDMDQEILVNNKPADLGTLVYENFSIDWTVLSYRTAEDEVSESQEAEEMSDEKTEQTVEKASETVDFMENSWLQEEAFEEEKELTQEELEQKFYESQKAADNDIRPTIQRRPEVQVKAPKQEVITVNVMVNGMPVAMMGKSSYIFVDVFDQINFNLNEGNGRAIATKLNGEDAAYTAELSDGDVIEIYWQEN